MARLRYDDAMLRRLLRLSAGALAALAAACVALHVWGVGVHLELIRWDEPTTKVVAVHDGKLGIAWIPRVPHRPRWAGQVNRYGFRYNVYSDGSWYAWAPLWAPGAVFAVAALLTGFAARSRRRIPPGHCPHCGYDLRASPQRCPECGAAAHANSRADPSAAERS
jgi:hypothetical protein